MRDLAHIVGRAVERVDDPGRLLLARPAAAFLGEQSVVGIELANRRDDRPLGGAVHLGHEVTLSLSGHFQIRHPRVIAQNDVAGPARCPDRDVYYGVHEMTAAFKRCPFYRSFAPVPGQGVPNGVAMW